MQHHAGNGPRLALPASDKEPTMSAKNTAVFGIYPDRSAVEEGVEHLRRAGFRGTDISVLFPENMGTKDFAHEKNTKAPEGAASGVMAGGIAGGVLGWLTGIGALVIPGLGPFVAAGPIVAALAGAGAVGALGGIIGALAGMGIPEYEARRYEGRVREGGVLLSVHCDNADWVPRAKGTCSERARRGRSQPRERLSRMSGKMLPKTTKCVKPSCFVMRRTPR